MEPTPGPLRDPTIRLIFAASLLLGVGYGIAISLFALFLTAQGYTKDSIGNLAACFAAGLSVAAVPVGALLRRYGARTLLTSALLLYALTVAAFPFLPGFGALAVARLLDGAASAGIWVGCETVLLLRADPKHKAYVTSVYALCISVGYVVGPLVARGIAVFLPMSYGFVAAGALASAAALLLRARLDARVGLGGHEPAEAPAPEREHAPEHLAEGALYRRAAVEPSAPLTTGQLVWRIKTSCLATYSYGYFQASVVLFLPLYLMESRGVPQARTIIIPAFFAAGMLLFTNVFGRLGDRFGHLRTMRALAVVGALAIASFPVLDSFAAMALAVFVAGGTLASISPVSLALQGAVVPEREYARANGIYNAFYAAGMLLGPPLSSQVFQRFGGVPMLLYLAALWLFFVLFSLVFRRDDPSYARA